MHNKIKLEVANPCNNNMEALYFILLLVLSWSIFNKYFITKIKNLPPTPWSALTIIGFRSIFKQPIHRTLYDIANRHGPILLLRFGCRRVLLISSKSAAEDLFTNNDRVFANRPELVQARVFGNGCKNLAWASHSHEWRNLRRVACLDMLSFRRLPDHHDSLADEVKKLLGQFYCNNKASVELKPMFLDLVFNVMMRMFAGKRKWGRHAVCSTKSNQKLENERCCEKKTTEEWEDDESISLLEYVTRSFQMTTGKTDLEYFMPILKLFGVTALEKKCRQLQSKGDSIMNNLLQGLLCQKEENVIKALLDKLLDKQKEDPKLYQTISGLVLVLVSAGTDTSAGILEWAFALLLNHPEVLQKAQNEIDKYVGSDRFLEQSDIDHLPYLRCIVKETLRLYPAAPLLVPHKSLKDCNVGGYYVPKGTMLLLNVWAIHNDPDLWNEPTRFNPERFERILDDRHGFTLMPFGYGRRSCPGKHVAMRVITLALGSLIHCFDWRRVGEERVDLTEQKGLALFKDKPLVAVCRPRSVMDDLLSQI